MADSLKQLGLRVISGDDRSLRGNLLRAGTALVEPFYATAMRLRNGFYDARILTTHNLGRSAVSVGNITTGGTGKTPVVQWLAEQLRTRGRHPAVLLRGYGSNAGISDECELLRSALNIPVHACPSRIDGAAMVLKDHPEVDLFLLDDAFQHRRAGRQFDLVLISATNPFGVGHVLPRGLLREPLSGLGRADAFLVTRCTLVSSEAVAEIDRFLQRAHPEIPIYHCDHEQSALRLPLTGQEEPMSAIADERVFVTAGIGDPVAFARQIELAGCKIVSSNWFDDHHRYTPADMKALQTSAINAGASWLITTEKDWVKLKDFFAPTDGKLQIAVVKLSIKFQGNDEQTLMSQLLPRLAGPLAGRAASKLAIYTGEG